MANPYNSHFLLNTDNDDDADTASQRSISLSSPARSPRHSSDVPAGFAHDSFTNRVSPAYTADTDISSEADDGSLYHHEIGTRDSTITSPASSEHEETRTSAKLPTYPPVTINGVKEDRESILSFTSTSSYSRKARPESMLLEPPKGPLVLGIALVDFNHLEGPKIEFSQGDIFQDEELAKILPFLALPDGAHLSSEDYSYFHLVPLSPNPTTVFGISCNRQIAASTLLAKDPDVTRSTVQKAVVVLASKPVFGPIRDKLGVVTRALFEQRDFRETGILVDFAASLEVSVRSQLTESGLYMGTSLRSLVRAFRQRTLILVKALILQKKIMFYGHPVERLCTYQYSLVSLLPGLLQTLDDCGSPPLASRAPTLARPSSLRTSDHKSMMAFMGLPLDLFGRDAFFQPYLPLQQLDMIRETKSWLCGSTNSIVTQQKEIDLLVNTETGTLEFRDPKLERTTGLTAADRKWMDDIVKDVNEGYSDDDDSIRPSSINFRGSDDYLRTKFEEYISSALASVKYRDFMTKGENQGVVITGGSGADANSAEDFNPSWITEFKRTHAYEVWDRITDPLLFDIVEPRHPCNEKPSVVSDIGLRLQEGIQELKLDQQLAPTREAISRTITAGQTNFFKAVEGVRGRWTQRSASSHSVTDTSSTSTASSTPVEISKSDAEIENNASDTSLSHTPSRPVISTSVTVSPVSAASAEAKAVIGNWGAGIGSFFSSRATRLSLAKPVQPESVRENGGPDHAASPTSPSRTSLLSSERKSISSLEGQTAATLRHNPLHGNVHEGTSEDELRTKDSDSIRGTGQLEPAGLAI